MRKTIFPALVFVLFITSANAQFVKFAPVPPAFSENLSKITEAFQNNYYKIQAEELPAQEDMDVYKSAVSLPGARHCVIYRFHSTRDTTASWQATMYDGENYPEALKAYKNACRLIDKSKVNLSGTVTASYYGKMDEPDPNLRFAGSEYRLNTKEPAYEKFYAEVELLNTGIEDWVVHINLHSKKDDDEK